MVRADSALPRVVVKSSEFGTAIQCLHCIFTERSVTHSRDIEETRGVGLLALRPTHLNSQVIRVHSLRRQRMANPFISFGIDVSLRSERQSIRLLFGSLVNN